MGMEVGKKWQQEQKRAQPHQLHQSISTPRLHFVKNFFISIPTPFSAFPLTRMKQMCHLLLLFLTLTLGALHSAYATRCYSCASPILRGDWQATGFPQYPPTIFTKPRAGDADAKEEPKQFAFTDKCDERGTTKLPLSECPGLCIEMVLATNGIYAIVRGCLDDFYPLDQPPATGEPGCFRSTTNQNVSIADKGGSNAEAMISVPQVTVGANICQTRETTKICNEQLAANSYFAKGVTSPSMATGWLSEVVAGYNPCFKSSGAVQCLKCARVDMEGTCDWNVRDYCNGAWCTKTIGYINGRWLEVRGCSSVNPLNTQSCSKLELDTQTSMIGDYQIPKHTSLEQCFCNNQRCNGAVRMLGLLGGGGGLPLMLLLALVPAILLALSSGGNSNFMMFA